MDFFMFFFHLFVDFVVAFPAPLSPYLVQFYHLNARTVAMAVAFLPFVGSLSQPLFAMTFRSFSFPTWQLYLTLNALLLPFFLFALPVSFSIFLIVFVTIFLADGYFHPVGAALAGRNRGGKGVTAFISGGILGGALGPFFITLFVSRYSLSSLWLFGLLSLPLSLWFFRQPQPRYQPQPRNFSWRFFGFFWPIWSLVSTRTFFSAAFHTFVPLYLNERGYPLLSGGTLLSLGVLCGIGANVLGSKLYHRFSNWTLNLISFLVLGSMILLFTVVHHFLLLFFFFIAADFATFLTMSTNVSEAQRLLPGNRVFASSLSMGFAWSMGHALNVLWAFLFGHNVQLVLQSVGMMAIGMGITLSLSRNKFTPQPVDSQWQSMPTVPAPQELDPASR